MAKNNINTEIPQEVIGQIQEKFKEIKELLQPYTVSLTKEERIALPKMSDKTVAFVGKVIDYISNGSEFVPPMMDTPALMRDFKTNQALQPLLASSQQISEVMKDTIMLSGSEAYTQALLYYSSVKLATKFGSAHAKTIQEDLGKRFPKNAKNSNENKK